MKVKELIEALQSLPQDATVYVNDGSTFLAEYYPATKIIYPKRPQCDYDKPGVYIESEIRFCHEGS